MTERLCTVEGCEQPHRARGYCKTCYNLWYQNGSPTARRLKKNFGVCAVEHCINPPRSHSALYCEKHYYRLRRNGSLELADYVPPPDHEHSNGYVLEYAPGHPLASSGRSRVYEHRRVLYDAIGAGEHPCHWCAKPVAWGSTLHVDHLDDVKTNNRRSNLVPSCFDCNTERGGRTAKAIAASARLISFHGETLPISAWAARIGVSRNAIAFRLDKGWPIDRALTEPRGKFGPQRGAR